MIFKQQISLFIISFCIVFSFFGQKAKYKIRTVAFYNVENLFDTINNPETFDEAFTPNGKNNYTSKVYWSKIKNLSDVISQIGFEKTQTSPAIIGLAEVENRSVLEDLIHSNSLKNKEYQIVHFDSTDFRGIDVAFLYQEKYFTPINFEKVEVKLWDASGKKIHTRDILLVSGLLDGELIYILVNHWPSRRGGVLKSNPKRAKAAYVVSQIIENIYVENKSAKIIIMGDFNDDPIDENIKNGLNSVSSFKEIHEKKFYNPMTEMYKKGLNTLGYRDGLHLFDQILLSNTFISLNQQYDTFKFYKANIFNPAYLITPKGRYKGYPFRSFSNSNYTGGYSDHFPVYIYLIKKEKP